MCRLLVQLVRGLNRFRMVTGLQSCSKYQRFSVPASQQAKSETVVGNKGQAKCGVVNDDQSAADKFNQHFVSIADKLRSLLKKVPIDFTRLKNSLGRERTLMSSLTSLQ